MMKNWENNGTEEIGLLTPTPGVGLRGGNPCQNHRKLIANCKQSAAYGWLNIWQPLKTHVFWKLLYYNV